MKKSLIVLTAALSFGFAAAQTAAPASAPQVPALTDVPAGHWAKDAIDRLVGRGILLGYPDGTFRGTQNLTRYEAAVIIARLLDQVRQGEVSLQPTPSGITPEDLTALQNAIQELAADLTALGVRVSDLEENAVSRDDFARLEARVEELGAAAGDDEAITGLTTQITELTTRVDELGGNYDELRADVDDGASSIAALNDLTVLLNQDILNLQDRVSAVEAAQADFVTRADFDNITGQLSGRIDATNTRVGAVEGRVTTLENAPKFGLTGALTTTYGYLERLVGPTDFDVDRLTNGTFAAGAFSGSNGADVTQVDTNSRSSNIGATNGLTFGIRASNLATTTGSLVVRNAQINFGVRDVLTNTTGGTVPAITLRSATADGTIGGQAFTARYGSSAGPASSRAFKFSDYLLSNNDGIAGSVFLGTLSATTLPLQPTITVVTGSTSTEAITGAAGTTANFAGVRAAVKPNADSTFAVSYANTQGNRVALGTDYNLKFGAVTVKGEGVASIRSTLSNNVLAGGLQNAINNSDRAFYTDVTADLGIAKFGVNFRAIDPQFALSTGNNAGLSINNTMPYRPDQVGFGGALGTNLGPIALGAYGDTLTAYTGGVRTTAFGAKAGVKLAALELVGFYNQINQSNNVVVQRSLDADRLNIGMGIADVPVSYSNSFGARLRHDGSATNALVKNLNFTVQDAYYYRERTNDLQAYADYSATVGGLTIQPLVRFHSVSNPAAAAVSGEGTTFKVGAKLSTAPFAGVPFQPSFYGNVVYRTTNPVTATANTTELLGQAGLAFNQFLAANTTAKVGYSYYEGRNLANAAVTGDTNDVSPFSAADDRVYNADTGTNSARVTGIYGQVGYNGLNANYGVFRYSNLNTGAESVGQGFKISYTFNF